MIGTTFAQDRNNAPAEAQVRTLGPATAVPDPQQERPISRSRGVRRTPVPDRAPQQPAPEPNVGEMLAIESAPAVAQQPLATPAADAVAQEMDRLRQSQDRLSEAIEQQRQQIEQQRQEIERLQSLGDAPAEAPTLSDRVNEAVSRLRAAWLGGVQAASPRVRGAWQLARSSDAARAIIAAGAVALLITMATLLHWRRSRRAGAAPQVAKLLALAAPDWIHRQSTADGPTVEPEFLSRVIRSFPVAQRKAWSKKLASQEHAPRDLAVALASDDIEIAEPLLSDGKSLTDEDLIAVIERRSSLHHRAIARRRDLTMAVADALVDTQKVDVIAALLRNRRARISEETMASIVRAARHVDSYREPIARRPDLSPRLAWNVYQWLPEGLRQQIDQKFSVSRVDRDAPVEPTVVTLPEPDVRDQAPAAEAAAEVTITPQRLIESLRQDNRIQFGAQLKELTGLSDARLQAILNDPKGDELAAICCALGIDRLVFASMFILTRKLGPPPHRAQPHEFARIMEVFDGLKNRRCPTPAGGVAQAARRFYRFGGLAPRFVGAAPSMAQEIIKDHQLAWAAPLAAPRTGPLCAHQARVRRPR